MTLMDFESELAERFELMAEGYWLGGMDLEDARQMAAQTLAENFGNGALTGSSAPN